MSLETINKEEVLQIHNRLVLDFADSEDPILPAGVRSDALLAAGEEGQA